VDRHALADCHLEQFSVIGLNYHNAVPRTE
jgi:hypothetical protein